MTIFGTLKLTFRNRVALTFSLLPFMVNARAQNAQIDAASAIRGTWIIKSIYRTQNVEGPDPNEQKKLVGSEIAYDDRSLNSCGQSVPITSIDRHPVDSAQFLANTQVRFTEVGIHAATVMEVVLNNRQAGMCFKAFRLPGQDVYLKSKDEIVIAFEGVFYRVVRKK
ncbi:MAG TPA: hypothetical protein VGL22_16130 [Terracidiphilus sp.]